MQIDGYLEEGRRAAAAVTVAKRHLVVIAPKRAVFHVGDLSLVASRAGWKLFDGRWDSDNAAPVVAAFGAETVTVALIGPFPSIEGEPLDRLLLRQGFRVVTVDLPNVAAPSSEPAAWVFGVTSFPTGRPPLPDDSASRVSSFDPTAIVRAADACP